MNEKQRHESNPSRAMSYVIEILGFAVSPHVFFFIGHRTRDTKRSHESRQWNCECAKIKTYSCWCEGVLANKKAEDSSPSICKALASNTSPKTARISDHPCLMPAASALPMDPSPWTSIRTGPSCLLQTYGSESSLGQLRQALQSPAESAQRPTVVQ